MTLERARAAALRLLKFRPRSESELKQRLAQKGFGPAAVEPLVSELKRQGLLDDTRFARLFVAQQMQARPAGRRMLVSRLRAKGVAAELATQTVATEAAGEDELELASRLAAKRAPALEGLPRVAAQRRLFGYLSRRGFSAEIIWKVVREIVHSSTGSE